MEKACRPGQTAAFTKGFLIMTKQQDEEGSSLQMETTTKEHGTSSKSMAMVSSPTLMEHSTQATGTMTNSMERV
jgi:hypothetical protein